MGVSTENPIRQNPPAWVECHSGTEYAERPVALHWGGERLDVAEILGRWRFPQGKRFRVRTADDQIFELFYDDSQDEWSIFPH